MTTFNSCTRILTTDRYSPKLMIDMIEKYRVTCIIAAPLHYTFMLKHPDAYMADFSSVRVMSVGGAVVSSKLKRMMEKLVPEALVQVIYGMTETLAFISYNIRTNEPEGSVGVLAPNITAKIIDSEGNLLEPDETGEVCLQTRSTFMGYFNNETATRDFIDSDNWMHSGDLGYFDDAGYLFIVGRAKDVIKYMGYQISPAEIEAVIERLNGVMACSVIGIPHPELGDLPAAAVVKLPTSHLTEEEIEEAVALRLSDAKKLRGGVYFVQALPRTVSGKVKSSAVKEMLIKLYDERNNNFIEK